ncbi:VanZ family protein [Clostridium sp. SHJSY1]|uniref:VanZ family protein n=1 Tax=Clostridium sp. SHJSY1 TaxID=2942483 RepID=UPI002875E0C6|nr:VanZ family protein [Clostridium sp. SHJSY1]MDS0525599.1 VanZ family protein [Clostridium sp. SHJSY1]
MYKKISVLLCILWMGFIFYNSSQNGNESNGLSYKIIDKIISIKQEVTERGNKFLVYAGPNEAKESNSNVRVALNLNIRKVAHGFEFFILAVLIANAYFAHNKKGKNVIINILFIVLFYAVTDEYHQIYVKGRHSCVEDVIIDFIGGIIGMTLFYCWYYFGRKRGVSTAKKKK